MKSITQKISISYRLILLKLSQAPSQKPDFRNLGAILFIQRASSMLSFQAVRSPSVGPFPLNQKAVLRLVTRSFTFILLPSALWIVLRLGFIGGTGRVYSRLYGSLNSIQLRSKRSRLGLWQKVSQIKLRSFLNCIRVEVR